MEKKLEHINYKIIFFMNSLLLFWINPAYVVLHKFEIQVYVNTINIKDLYIELLLRKCTRLMGTRIRLE